MCWEIYLLSLYLLEFSNETPPLVYQCHHPLLDAMHITPRFGSTSSFRSNEASLAYFARSNEAYFAPCRCLMPGGGVKDNTPHLSSPGAQS